MKQKILHTKTAEEMERLAAPLFLEGYQSFGCKIFQSEVQTGMIKNTENGLVAETKQEFNFFQVLKLREERDYNYD